jgi:hypothetical protein
MSELPPVCILTAGRGSRMGEAGKVFNKATFPLGDKAVISRLMAQFPKGTEFVIGLGYKGEQVRSYLELAHEHDNITFVEVDNFDGPESGPGYSLLCCKPHLQRPFYFLPVDTMFECDLDKAPKDRNWIGVAEVAAESSPRWCNYKLDADGKAVDIKDKQRCEGYHAFNGLLYVKDYGIFWKSLSDKTLVGGEHQTSNGTGGLMNGPGLYGVVMGWTDLGTEDNYRKAAAQYADFDFGKTDEAIYFVDGQVIKYFADEKIAANRVARAKLNPGICPAINAVRPCFYRYAMVPGKTLYAYNSPVVFKGLLEWLRREVWQPVKADPARMRDLCLNFYRDKTLVRLKKYAGKYPGMADPTTVNGEAVKPLAQVLKVLPWDELAEGVPSFFHGDCNFGNLLYDEAGKRYTAIDWRQDFGGETTYGDLYYDLAKLYGGTVINYEYIRKNLFSYRCDGTDVTIDFATDFSGDTYRHIFTEFVEAQGWSMSRVRILNAVTYLNMAPLHHAPYDQMLYALGLLLLNRELGDKLEGGKDE